MRIGIFGGTFNPVHLAHLIVAERLREAYCLERVLFVPAARPPHKEAPEAAAAHRLAMLRLAVGGNPAFQAADIELRRGGTSWSVDTLRELRRPGNGDELFFIIGMDAFAEIGSWHEAPALFGLADFIVIPRPGRPVAGIPSCLPRGVSCLPCAGGPAGGSCWEVAGGGRIHTVSTPFLDISSSDIRRRAREGRSIRYLVPDPVAAYIAGQGLYGTAAPPGPDRSGEARATS